MLPDEQLEPKSSLNQARQDTWGVFVAPPRSSRSDCTRLLAAAAN
jgi:hypothetical protein